MRRSPFSLCVLRPAFLLLSSGIAALLQATSAQSATVTFMWNANPEPNIAGYRLHYGTATHTYTQVIDVGNSTTATVSGLPEGVAYFFATTASNTSGFESVFSRELVYAAPTCAPGTFIFEGNSALSGTAGNIRPFTVSGVTLNVSGFSRVDSNGAWSTSWLGVYAQGLGVTGPSED